MEQNNIQDRLVNIADVITIIVVGGLLIVTAFAFFIHKNGGKGELATREQIEQETKSDPIAPVIPSDPFDAFSIEARAAIVYDIKNDKVVFEKNAHAALPLASLTKIMTGLTAFDTLPADARITIDQQAVNEEGDSGLTVGETWSLRNLLDFTLLVSSNDGAKALAAASTAFTKTITTDQVSGDAGSTFIQKMNQKAKEIGLEDMRFNNETGLDVDQSTAGGYGSAKSVALLVEHIMRTAPTLFEATRYQKATVSSDLSSHTAQNTDILVTKIPGMLASKTGYSQLAGGNLVVAFDAGLGQPYVAVVLGSSYDGRFTDVKRLVQATQKMLAQSVSNTISHD